MLRAGLPGGGALCHAQRRCRRPPPAVAASRPTPASSSGSFCACRPAGSRRRARSSSAAAHGGGGDRSGSGSGSGGPDEASFPALLSRLRPLPFPELQQLAAETGSDSAAALSASFLFWLSAQEKAADGAEKQELASLAAQLVYLKEQSGWEQSRRLLPPLASSLAYSNYREWQAEHGGQSLPDVAPGVSVADLYRVSEREEAKLKQWRSPQRAGSTLDSFASKSPFGQAGADAMARVRARLQGWDDDDTLAAAAGGGAAGGRRGAAPTAEGAAAEAGEAHEEEESRLSPAAQQVVEQLLIGCCCREERATLLPEAFVPPGLEVPLPGAAGGSARLVTTPRRVLAVLAWRARQAGASAAGSVACVGELLPSGEPLHLALAELLEDVQEYDRHVYRRLSRRDLYGIA